METRDVVALLAVAVAFGIGVANFLHSRRTHREGQIKDRKAAIEKALTEFYYPLLGYLNVSQALYKIFSAGRPAGFRTLTYLLDPAQTYPTPDGPKPVELTASDRQILREILRIGRKIEELIVTKSGYVDDRELLSEYVPTSNTELDPEVVHGQGLLAIAVTHLRLIRLAFQNNITGQVDRYRHFVYPRMLNTRINEKIELLRGELEHLSALDVTSPDPGWSIRYDPARTVRRID